MSGTSIIAQIFVSLSQNNYSCSSWYAGLTECPFLYIIIGNFSMICIAPTRKEKEDI